MTEPIEGEVVNQPTPPPVEEQLDPMAVLIVNKNPAGRPSDFTIATVSKLLAAFSNDYNISQACAYAGISRETFYKWKRENKYFSDKMDEAKDMPLRRAREVVIEAINVNKDANLAFRYLERRDPEFKPKAEVSNTPELAETRDKIKEFLDDDSPDDGGEQPTDAPSAEARGEVADAPTDIS